MRADVFAAGSAAGGSTAGGSDALTSVAEAYGWGTAVGVSYAFYSDTEKAVVGYPQNVAAVEFQDTVLVIPYDANRYLADGYTAGVVFEQRTAIVPFEDRVARVLELTPVADPPNRKRFG
jgi:hypothetical protein